MQRVSVEIGERDAVAPGLDDLTFLDRDHGRGPVEQRGDVRRQQGLAVADADHER